MTDYNAKADQAERLAKTLISVADRQVLLSYANRLRAKAANPLDGRVANEGPPIGRVISSDQRAPSAPKHGDDERQRGSRSDDYPGEDQYKHQAVRCERQFHVQKADG